MSMYIDLRGKSARDIDKMLRMWVLSGRMTSKCQMGRDYGSINKKYATGELLVTSIEGIDVTDNNAQKTFEALHESKRVMTKRDVMLKKGYTTLYQIESAVKRGELIKFDILGRSSILYIE